MASETERKFLVKGDFIHLAVKKTEIIQAYFSSDPDRTIRLRIAGNKALLGIKSKPKGKSITRGEWEYEIPLADAKELMEVCLPGKIEKTRYNVPAGKHVFEVDVFHGKNDGLVIAEIELESESERFVKPDWIGEEVTGKPEYYNVNLIK